MAKYINQKTTFDNVFAAVCVHCRQHGVDSPGLEVEKWTGLLTNSHCLWHYLTEISCVSATISCAKLVLFSNILLSLCQLFYIYMLEVTLELLKIHFADLIFTLCRTLPPMRTLRQLWDRHRPVARCRTKLDMMNTSGKNMWVLQGRGGDKQLCLTEQATRNGQSPLIADQTHGHWRWCARPWLRRAA